MASLWRWSVVVEANGCRQDPMGGETQGPDHATEDDIRKAVERGLNKLFPNGYKIVNFMATRLG